MKRGREIGEDQRKRLRRHFIYWSKLGLALNAAKRWRNVAVCSECLALYARDDAMEERN